jgi:hypothetical protein
MSNLEGITAFEGIQKDGVLELLLLITGWYPKCLD